MRFYTYIGVLGNKILVRGVNAYTGNDFIKREDFLPTMFVEGNKGETPYRTLDDKPVYKVSPGCIKDSRDFIKQYQGVDGFKIHGNDNFALQYTCEEWKDEVDYDISKIRIWNIDIEVETEKGFPLPEQAMSVVNAITVYDSIEDRYFTWGLGPWNNHREDIECEYFQMDTEEELLQHFLSLYEQSPPHILTGWNIENFDIPYLVNRMTRLFGQKETKRLSPFGWIKERSVRQMFGKESVVYDIYGVAIMDYMKLYKKFAVGGIAESYRLNHIAFVELGDRKLSYEEAGSLFTLARTDHQKFIDYNIKDVELVQRIDNKLKLIDLGITMAYDAKINFQDVFGTVKIWDAIIYDHLKKQDIVCPTKTHHEKPRTFAGAYVKEPITGFHNWVVSFDLNSLYPHLIMQYNISPETIVGHKSNIDVNSLLNKESDLSDVCEKGYTVAPNGTMYRKDKRGFLPTLMEKIYADRVVYKKKMLDAQQRKEEGEDTENDISKYTNIQMAKKIQLNSAYGAIGNQWFRYYDLRNAEAVTTGGQLAIRWIEKALNSFLNKYLDTEDYDYVIAIDTDSVYLRLGKFVDKFIKSDDKNKICDVINKVAQEAFEPFITKSYEELANYVNAYEQKMFMGREVIADKAVWTAKKRYALNVYDSEGVRYKKPKMKVTGMEIVKSSTPANVRGKLKEAVNIMLTGNERQLQDLVHKYKKEFVTLSIPDIAFPRGLSDYTKYEHATKSVPIHARAAKVYNGLLKKHDIKNAEKIADGAKLKFIYLRTPNPFGSNAIAFLDGLPPEFDVERWVDYETQFEKAFLSPLEGVLNPVGWDWEEKSTLESFFT
jgi:DNA polymerase elongation subunit (family B)